MKLSGCRAPDTAPLQGSHSSELLSSSLQLQAHWCICASVPSGGLGHSQRLPRFCPFLEGFRSFSSQVLPFSPEFLMISNKHASVQSLPTLRNFLLVLVLGCPLVLQLGCVITCDGSTSLPGGGGESQIPHTSKQLEPHFYKHCSNLSVFQTIPDLFSSATLFKHKGALMLDILPIIFRFTFSELNVELLNI